MTFTSQKNGEKINMFDGFIKAAAGTPEIKTADCGYNAGQLIGLINEAREQGVKILVLPELCITAYTCQDLFFQPALIAEYQQTMMNSFPLFNYSKSIIGNLQERIPTGI